MAELDCRIIAIFTLALSLVFLGSVIFFRHHQHIHRLTEDHFRDRVHRSSAEQLSDDDAGHEIKCLTKSDNPSSSSQPHIEESCFQCLCETMTDCKPAKCNDVPCGVPGSPNGLKYDRKNQCDIIKT
uniref:Uncharacterized protein n=1 Tax=Megaselia scalaris TaxID=36166 RepID=T1GST6_MEGSC